jgi:hypothetical protein
VRSRCGHVPSTVPNRPDAEPPNRGYGGGNIAPASEDPQPGNLDEHLPRGLLGVKMGRVVVVVIDRDRDPVDDGNGWHHQRSPALPKVVNPPPPLLAVAR